MAGVWPEVAAAASGPMTTTAALGADTGAPGRRVPDVEIVIPVYNEEAALGPSMARLHAYLTDRFPLYAWKLSAALAAK